MLRSPLAVLGEDRWMSFLVVLGHGAALWMLFVTAAMALQLEESAREWWGSYLPVIYVDSGDGGLYAEGLKEEVRGWSGSFEILYKGAEEILAEVSAEIGEEESLRLGLRPEMMPTVLVVELDLLRPGQDELIARIEALEVREEVLSVDVPGPEALDWVRKGRAVIGALGFAVVILYLFALAFLAVVLRHFQRKEGRENHLLELFGASSASLSRATWIRGATLGALSGGLGAALFVPWALSFLSFLDFLALRAILSAGTAALWALAMLCLATLAGFFVGLFCARPEKSCTESFRMESLLRWERKP